MALFLRFVLLSLASGIWALGAHKLVERVTTGDKKCGTLMCIAATVNGSIVEYTLSSTGKRPLGWMGMGFGRQMANTPMVITWLNPDGTVTLSQRVAPREVMPTVDPSPPRVATLSNTLSSIMGSTPSFGYTVPANSDTKQFVIYAYSTEVPKSSAADAELVQHLDFGTFQLDLTKSSSTSTSPGSSPTGGSERDTTPSDDIPLLPYQRLIVAHAIFCVVGFLLFLPAGALVARYLRTFTSSWFTSHWITQLLIAGPAILTGVIMGVQAVTKAGALHLNDNHKKLGVALFVLYLAQCSFGGVIHWMKPKNTTQRPPQNYVHAVLGLVIIALALYQVYSGFKFEWPKTTGRGPIWSSANTLFFVWLALLSLLYSAGLYFLPKQLRQENQHLQKLSIDDDLDMGDVHQPGYHDQE